MRRRSRCSVLVSLLAAGVLALSATQALADSDGVTLDWARPLPGAWLKADFGPGLDVSLAGPPVGAVTLFARKAPSGEQMVLKRWSKAGDLRWTRRWDGPVRRVTRVLPVAVAATNFKDAIYVAGNVTCRYGASERGPFFVRKYDVHGDVRWTRWDGRCPLSADGRLPPASQVTGLDVRGSYVALGGNYGAFCCQDTRSDGFVRLFDLHGRVTWHRDVEVGRFAGNEEAVLDVHVSVSDITLGGWVESQSREDATGDIDKVAFEMALVPWEEGRVWGVRLIGDDTTPDFDAVTAIGNGVGRELFAGVLDADVDGSGGRPFVEKVSFYATDPFTWRNIWPVDSKVTSVHGYGEDETIATGCVGPADRQKLLFRRYRPDGLLDWSSRWGPRGSSLTLEASSTRLGPGYGVGTVTDRETGATKVRLWKWRW